MKETDSGKNVEVPLDNHLEIGSHSVSSRV